MGSPKALLKAPDGRAFVARLVRTLLAADVTDIAVVTGRDHESISAALVEDAPPVSPRIVRNPDPSRGQLSSLLTGMEIVVTPQTDAMLMTLVDVPLVRVSTVTAVIDAAGLLTAEEKQAAGADGVLNGIAYDAKNKTFLITGKLWPRLFEVRFVAQ